LARIEAMQRSGSIRNITELEVGKFKAVSAPVSDWASAGVKIGVDGGVS
jgi:hypothetical protein